MSKERNAQRGIDFEVDTVLGLQRMHKMPVCPRGAAHTLTTALPLPSARLQLTPSLFAQLRVKFHKLIFSSHKKTNTHPFYETDGWRKVLS